MRFVTINLDTDDATVIHQTIIGAVERCDCDGLVGEERCASCTALSTVAADLDRMLHPAAHASSRAGRVWSGPPATGGARDRSSAVTAGGGRLRLLPRNSNSSSSRVP